MVVTSQNNICSVIVVKVPSRQGPQDCRILFIFNRPKAADKLASVVPGIYVGGIGAEIGQQIIVIGASDDFQVLVIIKVGQDYGTYFRGRKMDRIAKDRLRPTREKRTVRIPGKDMSRQTFTSGTNPGHNFQFAIPIQISQRQMPDNDPSSL